MIDFKALNDQIAPLDEGVMRQARKQWNRVGKPIGSLGELEEIVIRTAGLIGSTDVSYQKRAVIPMCSDNGVVEEGVSQCASEVTGIITRNFGVGVSSVCRMAMSCGVQVLPVDVGVDTDETYPGVDHQKVARGTGNIAKGPAMTPEQAEQAFNVGMTKAARLAEVGYNIIAAGEMGIGNTTTSTAVACALLGRPVQEMTGPGAGLPSERIEHKMQVIEQALAMNRPDPRNAFDVVTKVGGFDIAALAGLYIGAALNRIPIVVDGFVSAVAALVACKMCPNSRIAMIPSHLSAEPAVEYIFDELDMHPILHAGMFLGEGAGAVCLFPLLDMAVGIFNGMTFREIGVTDYIDYRGK